MKIYTIIGGLNGVGKSSFTGVLKGQRSDLGRIIDVDKIAAQLGGDPLAGDKKSIRCFDECLSKGLSFTQETTLSGYRTARKARELGYRVRLFYVGLVLCGSGYGGRESDQNSEQGSPGWSRDS